MDVFTLISSRRFVSLLGAGALFAAVSSSSLEVHAGPTGPSSELALRLASKDFRVRVQAALLLGKTGDAAALKALLGSLNDESAAVRAASAAALSTYGDPAALVALRAKKGDENPAVRRQVESTIAALESQKKLEGAERQKATVLVKLDGVKNRMPGGAPETLGVAAQASRAALRKIPGIALLHPSEDPEQAAATHHRPVIVVMGSIHDLSSEKTGEEFIVSVKIDFVVQSMPEYNIVGKLSGRASVAGDLLSTRDAVGRAKVQDAAVGAAVDSALGHSREALLAAAKS